MDGVTDLFAQPGLQPRGRVLIVDDEPLWRSEVAFALEASGFGTAVAADADAAFAAVTSSLDIEVVLSDIRMPGDNGITLANRLREAQTDQHAVEVVLMSAYPGFNDALRAVRAGAFDLVCKPFRLPEISAMVGRAMARARQRRRAALAAQRMLMEREALSQAAAVGLGEVGHDLRIEGGNAALARMFGGGPVTHVDDLYRRLPRLRQSLAPVLERMLAGDTAQAPVDLVTGMGDGSGAERALRFRLYPVPDVDDPRRVGSVGLICKDETFDDATTPEIEHRVRNTLGSLIALLHSAVRHAAGRDAAIVAAELEERVMVISCAHDMARSPAVSGAGPGAHTGMTIRSLARLVLDRPASRGTASRVALDGADIVISANTAPALALMLLELATNALKHGALSVPDGRVELAWSADADTLVLDWSEVGGPAVTGPPIRRGLGISLLGQFRGEGQRPRASLDWSHRGGLKATIAVPLAGAQARSTWTLC